MSKNILQSIKNSNERYGKVMGYIKPELSEQPTIREMMKRIRKLNEGLDEPRTLSQAEIDREKEKMLNYFANENVNIEFDEFKVHDNGVLLTGKIDNLIFSYQVVNDDPNLCKAEFNYNGINPSDPDNDKIIKMAQQYYSDFYKYWRDNELQVN